MRTRYIVAVLELLPWAFVATRDAGSDAIDGILLAYVLRERAVSYSLPPA